MTVSKTTPTELTASRDVAIRDARHHSLAAYEVVLLAETDARNGLDAREAERRLASFGPNVLPRTSATGPFVRFVLQFNNPLIYILLAAGAVTTALGELVDATVIFGVVLVNAIVGFLQESRAAAALDALRAMTTTNARVVRDGEQRRLDATQLVPGDLALLDAGDKVPADLRLLRHADLRVDESALTGESMPVAKDDVVLPDGTPTADRVNMVHAGTLVTAGSGAGVVVATGANTELGEIHRLVGSAESLDTPLTRKLAAFSKLLTVVILVLAGVVFAVGVLRGEPTADVFVAAVALAVGAIPEGLPAAVTITLAIGVSRMARRSAVVRRLPAVETLGGTTVICSDKTGTLTENRMTVRRLWTASGGAVDAAALAGDQAARLCLVAGARCNDAALGNDGSVVGDPTETAMLVAARDAGVDLAALAEHQPRLDVIPFSSELRYMATSHPGETPGSRVVYVKGAVEQVVELCSSQLDADATAQRLDRETALTAAAQLAGQGMRVLATAVVELGPDDPRPIDHTLAAGELRLAGLQAMLDPPRAAAAAAVASCHRAGLDVKMITGDHAATATAIARQIGLVTDDEPGECTGGTGHSAYAGRVLTGVELDTIDDESYPDAVERATVFARVSPEQKLRLVRTLQERRHVVAMTGDGVNDAPALQQADIGIAMGHRGTDVAKDASDMVLTDDDFATIEAAVEEGRGVFDNITKFIVWTLPTNMGEGLVILVAVLVGSILPILPVQILWINMTTAVALGLMLAFEPREPGIMSRPPRSPERPLLTGALVRRILLVSGLLVVGAWGTFAWAQSAGASDAEARTAAVNAFVAVEILYLFVCRTLDHSTPAPGLLSNRWIVTGVSVQLVAQAALTYLPVMNTLFQTAPLPAATWLVILAVAMVTAGLVSVEKRFTGRRF